MIQELIAISVGHLVSLWLPVSEVGDYEAHCQRLCKIKKQDVSTEGVVEKTCPMVYRLQELGKTGVLCPKAMLGGGEHIVGIKESLKLGSN